MCWFLYYFKQQEFRAQKIPLESRALRSWFLRSQEMRYCQSTNWFSNEILGQFLLLKNNSDNKGELFWQCLYVCLSLKHFKIYIYWIETSGKKCFSLSYCIFCSLVTKMSFLPPLASYCCFSTKTKWKEIEGKKGGNGKLLSKVISVGIFNNALAWQQKQVLKMISAELLFWAGLGTTTTKKAYFLIPKVTDWKNKVCFGCLASLSSRSCVTILVRIWDLQPQNLELYLQWRCEYRISI